MGIDGWPTNGWNMKYFSQVAMKAQKVTFEIHDGTKVTTIVPGKATYVPTPPPSPVAIPS